MKINEYLEKEIINIEYYGAKKPKYHYDEQSYVFAEDSLVALSTFDSSQSLKNLFELIKDKIIEEFSSITIKDYSNADNYEGFAYLDQNVIINYQEQLNQQTTAIKLLNADNLSFSYLLIKVIFADDTEILIWVKLKSPLKVSNNTFVYQADEYNVTITKDHFQINNYPLFKLDLNLIAFIYVENDFYILNKELYQKYFNLETYYYTQASQLVYHNDVIISDGNLLTKANAKLIFEYFDRIEQLTNKIADGTFSQEQIKQMITRLDLAIDYTDDNKFILKEPKDLLDLLLLSCGCLGINSLTNEPFKIKRPQYLVNE